MKRNSPDKALNEKQKLNTTISERRLRYVWKTTYDIMSVASARLKRAKRGKKERREGKIKSKKGEQGKMTAINSLSFPFLSFFLSFLSPNSLSFPFLSLRQRERKGRSRKKKRIRKGRGKKKKGNRVYCCHLSSLLSFFSFFPLSFFFFLLLSLVLYWLPVCCPMSLLCILKTVTQSLQYSVVVFHHAFLLKYSSECILLLHVNSFRSRLNPSGFFWK